MTKEPNDPKTIATTTGETAAAAPSRRRFLKAGGVAAGAAAATVAFPQVSRAQTVTWRFQSTWPARDIFHEIAAEYVKMVGQLSGGRLKLDLLPAGAVVGALQMQDAVIAGALDGGHGVTAYWYGKNKAYSLFGTPPSFGWQANEMLGWFYYGGGEALYNELVHDILKLDLVGFLNFPMPNQPLGWFKKVITSADQMRNMKYRTVGLAADVMREMGVAVTILGGGDIVPAIDRGLIEGAEFNNPSSDRLLGFPDVSKVWMLQSYHQAAECFEIIFNRTKFNALPEELRAVLRYAAYANSADMSWRIQDRYTADLGEMREKQGVQTYKTPDSVLEAQLQAWDKVIETLSKDPYFKKVIDSQKTWNERVVAYFLDNEASQEKAYTHFFGKGKRGLLST
ncbi:MAG: TRAP transporter substrate-binding protein [Rhodospirillales bacterium]